MSKFINRKQFIAATQSLHCETCDHRIDCLLCNVGRMIRKIKNFPSADVAPVVHCSDCCKYHSFGNGYGECSFFGRTMKDSEYCSNGLKKVVESEESEANNNE